MIGQTVSHYTILEKLGGGGMGIVYKAQDLQLDRLVALKFLPPELTQDPNAKARFVQEAKAASALEHVNICSIHEIGEHHDQIFIVMGYYEGETLREKIEKGSLPVDEAIDLIHQVAAGLSKAHETGIVHRDIKPANIIVTKDGTAKVLDFGLAKLSGREQLTKVGTTVGTIAYVSPEQALGEAVDRRADIWSLGVVMYEAITGQLPFRSDYDQGTIYSILNERPKLMSERRLDVPVELEQMVMRAMQKNVADRFQTMDELMAELASVRQAIDTGETVPRRQRRGTTPSVAVLPFENLSPDPDNAYFADGLTEELIATLSKVRALRVISRTSAMLLRGSKKDVPTIARELNVRYVLEGSVRRAGNSLRITAQLIDAPADTHLWADAYAGTLEDIFGIQESVARAIAAALEVKLDAGTSAKLAERPITNTAAYDYYLRAIQSLWQYTDAGLARATEHLERAISIEGDTALLHGALAYVYCNHGQLGIEPMELYRQRARESANRAFALDPETPLAHLAIGVLISKENPAEGIRSFKRVLQSDPNHVEALVWLAMVIGWIWKPEVGRSYLEQVRRLDPLHPALGWIDGLLLMWSGNFEEAARVLRESLRLIPQPPTHYILSWTLALAGQREEACRMFDEFPLKDPRHYGARMSRLMGHVLRDDRERAWEMLRSDLDASEFTLRDYEWSYLAADVHALLGDTAGALEWLERSVRLGNINYPVMSQYDSLLASLRGDERFKKLMERVRKEWEEFEV